MQWLNLHANPIGVKGATAFAEMLLNNKSLKKLDPYFMGEEAYNYYKVNT